MLIKANMNLYFNNQMRKKVDQDQEADQRKNKNKRRKKIDYILFQNLMLFPITVKLFESLNHKFGLFIYFI